MLEAVGFAGLVAAPAVLLGLSRRFPEVLPWPAFGYLAVAGCLDLVTVYLGVRKSLRGGKGASGIPIIPLWGYLWGTLYLPLPLVSRLAILGGLVGFHAACQVGGALLVWAYDKTVRRLGQAP